MQKSLAPIVLFVYNRPWHTRQTMEALKENLLASESEVIIYSDGPKNNEDLPAVEQVRDYIHSITGFKKITQVLRKNNMGLADSIISGVTETVNKFGKVIVLEDDIVTSKGFLKFMNDALDLYENEEKVMHISGYMYPVKTKLPETFFYNTTSCWGWATWKRAWDYFIPDARLLIGKFKNKRQIYHFNIEGSYDFYGQLKANVDGTLKTWGIKWYASFFFKNGFSLHPGQSLTQNIGFDNSGTNCGSSTQFDWGKLAENIDVKKNEIVESSLARRAMKKYYKSFNAPLYLRIKGRIIQLLPIKARKVIKILINKNK